MANTWLYDGTLVDKLRQFAREERDAAGPLGGFALCAEAANEIRRLNDIVPKGDDELMTTLRRSLMIEALSSIKPDLSQVIDEVRSIANEAADMIEDMRARCAAGNVNPGVCAADARDAAIAARIIREEDNSPSIA